MARKKHFYIGLDLGFGNIKAVAKNESILFPSVMGQAREMRFGKETLTEKYPNEQITHDNSDFFVGKLAMNHLSKNHQRRLRGRTGRNDEQGMDFRTLMMKATLAKLFPNELNGDVIQVRIVTGLPVNHMGQSSLLKTALLGQHHVQTDSTNFVADVNEVVVMPEPRGTMFAFMLTDKGKINAEYTANTTVVFNGGEVTNDVQFDREGEFIDDLSQSSETGHVLALNSLKQIYEERYGEEPTIAMLKEILHNKRIRVFGEWESFNSEVEQALKPVREGGLQLLADTIQAGTAVDSIIVSGGIAITSFDNIKGVYKQSIKSDNPLYDTAQGYYNYSQMKWG